MFYFAHQTTANTMILSPVGVIKFENHILVTADPKVAEYVRKYPHIVELDGAKFQEVEPLLKNPKFFQEAIESCVKKAEEAPKNEAKEEAEEKVEKAPKKKGKR